MGTMEVSPEARSRQQKGNKLLDEGSLDEAMREYSEAIRLQPAYAAAWHNRGLCLLQKGRVDAAISDFTQALKIDSDPLTFVKRAEAFIKKHDLTAALSDLDTAIRLDQGLESAYFHRARVYQAQGNLSDALVDLNHAISLNPKSVDDRAALHYNRALLYRTMDQYDDAIADLDEAARLTSRDPDVFSARGTTYCLARKWGKARADLAHALRLGPTHASAYFGLALLSRERGDNAGVIRNATRGLQIEPCNAHMLQMRGIAYTEKRRYAEAIVDFDEALRQDPAFALALSARSKARRMTGDLQGALSDINAALELEPGSSLLLNNRAAVWLDLGEPDKACDDCIAAIRQDPTYGKAYYNLAMAQAAQGEREAASESLEKAYELDPTLARMGRRGCRPGFTLLRRPERGREHRGDFSSRGGPDQLIDQLVKMSREYSMQEGIDYIWNSFVPDHIAQLNCQFFDRFMERISSARAAGEKARLKNLLGMVLNAVVSACHEPIQQLLELTNRRDITEKDVEAFLKTSEKKHHFVLYAGVIFMFMRLYESWERLHTPDQAWEGPILRMVVRVAGRLQPEAAKVAALIATAAPE